MFTDSNTDDAAAEAFMENKLLDPILVTGGCGFIGSNMVRHLVRDGVPVVTLDILGYASSERNLDSVAGNSLHRLVKGSIGDRQLVLDLLREIRPRALINFAAQTHVDRSIDAPDPFIETNILGTFSLFEATRAYLSELPKAVRNAFLLIHVSTDEVFGSSEAGSFSESDRQNPTSPYSASKAAADNLAAAWHATYQLPIIVTHCTNNYGPFQFPEKLIPQIILRALQGRPLPLYGDGLNSRDWLYVDDHVAALRCIMDRGKPGQRYNVGGGAEMTNLGLVQALCAILDRVAPRSDGRPHADNIQFVTDRPAHDRRYSLECGKVEREFSWKPKISLDEGLRSTVDWYLNNRSWWESILASGFNLQRIGLGTAGSEEHA